MGGRFGVGYAVGGVGAEIAVGGGVGAGYEVGGVGYTGTTGAGIGYTWYGVDGTLCIETGIGTLGGCGGIGGGTGAGAAVL